MLFLEFNRLRLENECKLVVVSINSISRFCIINCNFPAFFCIFLVSCKIKLVTLSPLSRFSRLRFGIDRPLLILVELYPILILRESLDYFLINKNTQTVKLFAWSRMNNLISLQPLPKIRIKISLQIKLIPNRILDIPRVNKLPFFDFFQCKIKIQVLFMAWSFLFGFVLQIYLIALVILVWVVFVII